MTSPAPILVLGATGTTGRRVAARLADFARSTAAAGGWAA